MSTQADEGSEWTSGRAGGQAHRRTGALGGHADRRMEVGTRVVKLDVLVAPGRRGRCLVANVWTSGRTQRSRGKTTFT